MSPPFTYASTIMPGACPEGRDVPTLTTPAVTSPSIVPRDDDVDRSSTTTSARASGLFRLQFYDTPSTGTLLMMARRCYTVVAITTTTTTTAVTAVLSIFLASYDFLLYSTRERHRLYEAACGASRIFGEEARDFDDQWTISFFLFLSLRRYSRRKNPNSLSRGEFCHLAVERRNRCLPKRPHWFSLLFRWLSCTQLSLVILRYPTFAHDARFLNRNKVFFD